MSRKNSILFKPGKGVWIMFQKDPGLGQCEHKSGNVPVVKEMEMDPPAFGPKPSPAPSTTRLDLDDWMHTNAQSASVITDNIVTGSRHFFSFLLRLPRRGVPFFSQDHLNSRDFCPYCLNDPGFQSRKLDREDALFLLSTPITKKHAVMI
jgi:hypothetical protein